MSVFHWLAHMRCRDRHVQTHVLLRTCTCLRIHVHAWNMWTVLTDKNERFSLIGAHAMPWQTRTHVLLRTCTCVRIHVHVWNMWIVLTDHQMHVFTDECTREGVCDGDYRKHASSVIKIAKTRARAERERERERERVRQIRKVKKEFASRSHLLTQRECIARIACGRCLIIV